MGFAQIWSCFKYLLMSFAACRPISQILFTTLRIFWRSFQILEYLEGWNFSF